MYTKNSITVEQLQSMRYNKHAYIRYLLRVGAFKKMSDMARDLGVKAAWIRSIKHRENASPEVCNTGMQG